MPSTDKDHATGQRSHCNPAVQERQGGAKSSRCDVRQTCSSLDHTSEVPGGRERIHVSPTPAEPAIKAVSKGRRVGNGNVQTADLGRNDASYLTQRSIEIVKVLETMVRNDCCEHGRAEWEHCRVSLYDQRACVLMRRRIPVESDAPGSRRFFPEASLGTPEIKDVALRRQTSENLVHASVLQSSPDSAARRHRTALRSFTFADRSPN